MKNKKLLFDTQYWNVYLTQDQAYLGRCVIATKEQRQSLSALTSDEWTDFYTNIVTPLEKSLESAFEATMFNWTCMMNNAYKESNPQPHVHWHFRPRYNKPIVFEGMQFEDSEFGSHYDRTRGQILNDAELTLIAEHIKKHINS